MSERCGEGRAGQARGEARLTRHPNVLNKNYSCKWQDVFKKDNSGLGPGDLGPTDPTAPCKNQSVARSLAWPGGHAPSLAHTPHRQRDTRTHTHCPLEACPGSTPPRTPSCSHPGLPTPTRSPPAPRAPPPTQTLTQLGRLTPSSSANFCGSPWPPTVSPRRRSFMGPLEQQEPSGVGIHLTQAGGRARPHIPPRPPSPALQLWRHITPSAAGACAHKAETGQHLLGCLSPLRGPQGRWAGSHQV